MSRNELTPFSYTILTLVGERGAGPYDIVRMMRQVRQGRIYWTAAESHYYAEPKLLAKLGYLAARKEPGRTRERTHYTLTEKGREALRAWVAEPATLPRIQHEAIVKLLAADLVDDRVVLESLQAMRADIADASARLDVAEAVAETLPHRKRYLRLVHGLGRALLETHLRWLEDVERPLRPAERSSSRSVP
ncbi:MAG TPA: PadR family transcriptional regulator [Gaiellaceae bacterium]